MKEFLKKYKFTIIMLIILLGIAILYPDIGKNAINITWENTLEMLSVIPPIFLLLGLLDVWVPRETMIRLMGDNSGLIGILIAFLLGSVAAGPLYAAFPVSVVLLKKGTRFSNVLIFIGAWSTTKIPLLLFEASAMGYKFMMTRLIIDIFGIIGIAYITEKLMNNEEKQLIYTKVQEEY